MKNRTIGLLGCLWQYLHVSWFSGFYKLSVHEFSRTNLETKHFMLKKLSKLDTSLVFLWNCICDDLYNHFSLLLGMVKNILNNDITYPRFLWNSYLLNFFVEQIKIITYNKIKFTTNIFLTLSFKVWLFAQITQIKKTVPSSKRNNIDISMFWITIPMIYKHTKV